MSLGEKIKELRKQKGLSQEQLADKLNVSRQTVQKWEKDINEPSVDTIKNLVEILDTDIEYLLYDKTNKVLENSKPKKHFSFKQISFLSKMILGISLLTICLVAFLFIYVYIVNPYTYKDPNGIIKTGLIAYFLGNDADKTPIVISFICLGLITVILALVIYKIIKTHKTKTILPLIIAILTILGLSNIDFSSKATTNFAKDYAKSMGITDYEDVIDVYISNNVIEENNDIESYYFGNDYYIDVNSIKTNLYLGEKIASRTFDSVDNAYLKIDKCFEASFSYGLNINDKEVLKKLGYNKHSSFRIIENYQLNSDFNGKVEIACYLNIERKDFTVYEDDIYYDDYVGEYYSTKPIGCSFFVYQR